MYDKIDWKNHQERFAALLSEAKAWKAFARKHVLLADAAVIQAKTNPPGDTAGQRLLAALQDIAFDMAPGDTRMAVEECHLDLTSKKNVRTRDHMRRLRHGRSTGDIRSPAVMSIDDLPDNIDDILKEMESTRPD